MSQGPWKDLSDGEGYPGPRNTGRKRDVRDSSGERILLRDVPADFHRHSGKFHRSRTEKNLYDWLFGLTGVPAKDMFAWQRDKDKARGTSACFVHVPSEVITKDFLEIVNGADPIGRWMNRNWHTYKASAVVARTRGGNRDRDDSDVEDGRDRRDDRGLAYYHRAPEDAVLRGG